MNLVKFKFNRSKVLDKLVSQNTSVATSVAALIILPTTWSTLSADTSYFAGMEDMLKLCEKVRRKSIYNNSIGKICIYQTRYNGITYIFVDTIQNLRAAFKKQSN